jgi:DNA polymerase III alpha subunit
MFSAITFHDHARSGASTRSSAARSTSRQAAVTTGAGPSANYNHLVLLAESKEGWHNLIKLVSAGYTEGFYRKPRIDKRTARAALGGHHRPEQLPAG